MKVLVIGAGGHGQVVADMLRASARAGEPIEFAGYLDDRIPPGQGDDPSPGARELRAGPSPGARELRAGPSPGARELRAGGLVLGPISALSKIAHDCVVVAVGDNDTRARLTERLRAAGEHFIVARHPSAVVSDRVCIGDGAMICAGVIVCVGSSLGRGVILNTGCTIDHHSRIGDYSHIAPGVRIGGEVSIGERAFIGIGAVILPRVTIGRCAIVGAGAVVTRDVPPAVTVVGVPARVLNTVARGVTH